MHLTLSIDKELLEKARATARAMGISLDEMIRNHLRRVTGVGDQTGSFLEFRALCLTQGGHSEGQVWNREDLHHRQSTG